MEKYKVLKSNEIYLNKDQLENYIERLSIEQIVDRKSKKQTYPVYQLRENFNYITKVYELLNENIKQEIVIHPAGEWLLDNYYIIEENYKTILKDLTIKQYTNLPGLVNGNYKGIARIYILANEIVKYTNNQINKDIIERVLKTYQKNKNITIQELWNLQCFFGIAIIQSIKDISEKIYTSQKQKMKVVEILKNTVMKESNEIDIKTNEVKDNLNFQKRESKYSFIEYMSYSLKKYGRKGYPYMKALEEIVEKMGITVEEIIRKEHFMFAVSKVSMANAIISIRDISRINFQEIFDTVNGVEDILKKDPLKIYENMTYETKNYYKSVIIELSEKTNTSEIFIANKVLELAAKNYNEGFKSIEDDKKSHVGYYLIDKGKIDLLKKLNIKNKEKTLDQKKSLYVITFFAITVTLTIIIGIIMATKIKPIYAYFISLILYIPIVEIYMQIVNYILIKTVKPKLIPKINNLSGIDENHKTFVVIPTIVNSVEKVKKLLRKLEVFYLANKSKNIYFAVLGDCTTENEEHRKEDDNIIKYAKEGIENLNNKYKTQDLSIFHFIYRKRIWSSTEKKYMGWERKRGLLCQFNKYLISNKNSDKRVLEADFLLNTLDDEEIPKIKYIISLDGDTNLTLNTALELIGAKSHILNKPIIKNKIVVEGYGIIQPRIGIDLENVNKTIFTEIYSEQAGVDTYTNAVSDVYEDNFREAIYTGKGIYDLEVFNELLSDSIPENKVLSHDLLESTYLKCGLASDILLLDGYPSKYSSYISRNHRWIRGDWQIVNWIASKVINNKNEIVKNPINKLSKFKVFDNLRRSVFPITSLILLFINYKITFIIGLVSVLMPLILDLFNYIVYRKEINEKQINFSQTISGIKKSVLKGILEIVTLPDKVYTSIDAIVKTLYRLKTKNNLLEWITAEEAELLNNSDLKSYYKKMYFSVIIGILMILYFSYTKIFLGLVWIFAPYIMWYISKPRIVKKYNDIINTEEEQYIKGIAKKTWSYFETYMVEDNNFLPPDNYQIFLESTERRIAYRTSSTNIGLGLLTIISAYDMKFIDKDKALYLIEKVIYTINRLVKWNGHLYNWYDIKSLEPLRPRYISTVDSGNLIGYLYVVKQFLIEKKANETLISNVTEIINNTNFMPLYNPKIRLFSIGYNIEEGKLTDSYYDFLASEARQASFIAIAMKQISPRHWNNLSRTLTVLNGYKGLVSWSGTAFEYLMPNIIMKKYENSLIDESCKFLIMSSKLYAEKLRIPWGISESAFNLKDLYGNYQYKAFGIPWLGVKRGLADDAVISPYSSVLAIGEDPKGVIKNLKAIEEIGGVGEYGLYEAIDFTPERLQLNEKYAVVTTYMAHHQGLILLSINNLINNEVLQNRFYKNPEIEAIDILLQEKMPRNIVITKTKKEKIEKLKYKDYEDFAQRVITKLNSSYENTNFISNDNYMVFITDKGDGYSKLGDIYINNYKKTSEEMQGIKIYIKNKKFNRMWSMHLDETNKLPTNYTVIFSDSENEFERLDGNILTKLKITVSPEDNVEIRKLVFKNFGNLKETLEINTLLEPILCTANKYYAHPAFNNMSIEFENHGENIIIKRRMKTIEEENIYLAVTLYGENSKAYELQFEIDKNKIMGRNNNSIPELLLNAESENLSNEIALTVNPMLLLRKNVEVEPQKTVEISYIMAISNTRENALRLVEKYKNKDKIIETFDLQKAKVETENRYFMIKNSNILGYQEMLRELLYKSYFKKNHMYKLATGFENKIYLKETLWKFGVSGDFPYILVKIKSDLDIEVISEILKAYEYFKLKNVKIDLIIVNEEEYTYEGRLKNLIDYEIQNNQLAYMINNGIYVLNNIEKQDCEILEFRANLIIDASLGNLQTIIKEQKQEYLEHQKYWNINNGNINSDFKIDSINDNNLVEINKTDFLKNLKFSNEYGGFTQDGKEYHIQINKNQKLPIAWSNILSNKTFGTLLTETGGGYTWCKNARLNRVTAWNNNPIIDIPSEIIYLKNMETQEFWTLGYSVVPKNIEYNILYGFGYVLYKQIYDEVLQENQVYVPTEDNLKVNYINIRNTSTAPKKLKIIYYVKPVLGEDEIDTNANIYTNLDIENNIVSFKNLGNKFDINDSNNLSNTNIAYISSSEKIISYTGSKKSFIGSGNLTKPETLILNSRNNLLDNQNGLYEESIIALEIELNLKEYENKEITLILGEENSYEQVIKTRQKYTDIEKVKQELDNVKEFWSKKINKLQVRTPDEATNVILNGWAIYQTLVSRLYGKTGYYQSGGAAGYRDQLQDSLGIKYIDKELLRNQIIKVASHQFKEGDVLHWWHEENNRGIRTRFSDDLLWLPYAVLEYIEYTGDYKILKLEIPYLEGELLKGDLSEESNTEGRELEHYDIYLPSEKYGNILEHLFKSVIKGMQLGKNGFLKIGTGDWNDGFSTVGDKGKGESIWLTFFMYYILQRLKELFKNFGEDNFKINIMKMAKELEETCKTAFNIPLLDEKNIRTNKILKVRELSENSKFYINNKTYCYQQKFVLSLIELILVELRKNLEQKAWDGEWFIRAINDEGKILGTSKNTECRIDSIAQSWSVISNAVSLKKQVQAFENVEKYLIDKESKILKLLTPAFDKSDINPGYIREYINGIRENGGQYTHGALWFVWAATILGYNDKAFEYYKMFNPINHALSKIEADIYKVEPFVIAADIYGEKNLLGRGGWTWYTGASAWLYRIGIENILGLKIQNDKLSIKPCVPNNWNDYKIRYIYGESIYNIEVKRSETDKFILNGIEIEEKEIKLVDNGKINDIVVYFNN